MTSGLEMQLHEWQDRYAAMRSLQDKTDARLVALQCRVETLFDALAHGDDEHRAWLKARIEEHFK